MSSNHPAPADAARGGTTQPEPLDGNYPGRYSHLSGAEVNDGAYSTVGVSQPPPPATATPARTLADELRLLVQGVRDRGDSTGSVSDYWHGYFIALARVDAMLANHPALRQPAPVAADGAGRGERRWGVRIAGKLRHDFHIARGDAERSRDELVGVGLGPGEVVPVRVTVLADDAGAAGAGETRELALEGGWRVQVKPNKLSIYNADGRVVGRFRNAALALANFAFAMQRLAAAEAARAAAEGEATRLREAIKRAGFAVMQTSGAWDIYDVSEQGKAADAKSLAVATENVELSVENGRLRSALEWYADERTYAEAVPAPGEHDGVVPIEQDKGARARAALAAPAGGAAGRDGKA